MAGRHKYKPTEEHRRQVMTMAGFGIQQVEIAALIDCAPKTLRRYYRRELDTAATEANMRVAQSLYKNAVQNESVAAQIWWTKARMGWREAQDLNVGGTGQPVAVAFHWAPAAASQPAPPTIEAETETSTPLVVQWRDA
jgi:hypothetical protein